MGVAPEDEVCRGDVLVGDGRVVLEAGFAAELATPVFDGVGHFVLDPSARRVVHGLSRRADHDEAVHQRVIDGALEVVAFVEAGLDGGVDGFPGAIDLAEVGEPGAVGLGFDGGELAVVDGDAGVVVVVEGAVAGLEGEGESGNVFRGDFHFQRVGDFGFDFGAIPMVFEGINLDQFIWLYFSVQVLNLTCQGAGFRPFEAIESIRRATSALATGW